MDITLTNREDGSVLVSIYNGQNQVVMMTVAAPTLESPQPDITLEAQTRKCVFSPPKAGELSPVVEIINSLGVEADVSLQETQMPNATMRTPFGQVVVGPTDTTLPPPPL